jgi:hypothetical protein
MPLCDSSETYTRAVWPEPSPAVPRLIFVAGISEVSRFSCMKCLGVSGVRDQGYSPDEAWQIVRDDNVSWGDVANVIDVVEGLHVNVVLLTITPHMNVARKSSR